MEFLKRLKTFFSFRRATARVSIEAETSGDNAEDVKRLLEEFREHDYFLNESQRISGSGSWIWDVKNDKVKWSDNLYRIYDIERTGFEGDYSGYLKQIPEDERDRIHTAITEAYEQQRPFSFEHHVITRTGEVRLLSCLGEVLIEDGEVKAMVGTSLDITDQRELEISLRKQREDAENSSMAKTKFLASMSHEIRTPISAVVGFAELLNDPSITETERQNFISLLRANATWLSELIENVLDLSKVEADKVQVELVKTNFVSLFSTVRDLVSGKENALPTEFRFKGLQPRTLTTDPTKLRQILINIIRNAQKFTRTGKIVVRTQTNFKLRRFLIDIADTGIGMTIDQQKKVFQAFQQADGSTARNFGGTGLGLTLSKQFADLLGGNVVIKRSRPGRGTIFRVELPLTKSDLDDLFRINDLPRVSEQIAHEEAMLDKKSILLVDDSRDNLQIVERFLQKAGAFVTTAGNGKQALDIMHHRKFDLVLMDLQMPIMGGAEATREIRKKDKHTPIVALTANALLEEKNQCLRLGFSDYLTKPINRRALLEHVSQEFNASLQ